MKRSEGSDQETPGYCSPWRVLARAFEKSRDLWKEKYKTLQERIKEHVGVTSKILFSEVSCYFEEHFTEEPPSGVGGWGEIDHTELTVAESIGLNRGDVLAPCKFFGEIR